MRAGLAASVLLALPVYFALDPTWAVLSAMVVVALISATLKCLESVFLVALYNYAALGETDGWFPAEVLDGGHATRRAPAQVPGVPPARRAAA